jgi:hypothetical protein
MTKILFLLLIAMAISFFSLPLREGFSDGDPARASKCYSCEAQDRAMGLAPRDYGSKCISCEVQDRRMGIFRGYGVKWA